MTDDLLAQLRQRAKPAADREGIPVDVFLWRAVDDAATYAEATHEELDAADTAATQPAKSNWLDRAIAARSGPQVFHIEVQKADTVHLPAPGAAYRKTMVFAPDAKPDHGPLKEHLRQMGIEAKQRKAEILAEREAEKQRMNEYKRQQVEGLKAQVGRGKADATDE
jgi:hypothetical protein